MSNMIFSFVGASVSLGIAAVLFISTKYSGAWRRKSSSFPSVGGLDYRTVKGVTEAAEKVLSTPSLICITYTYMNLVSQSGSGFFNS